MHSKVVLTAALLLKGFPMERPNSCLNPATERKINQLTDVLNVLLLFPRGTDVV